MPTTIETPPSTSALSAQEAAMAGRKYIKKKAVRRRFTSLRTFFSILLFTLDQVGTGAARAAQSLDVETSIRYLFIFSNPKDDGPAVLDVPPAVAWPKFFGTILG
jgi:hypothetical protein